MEDKDTNHSSVSLKQVPVGYEFPPSRYELDGLVVSKYVEAVGEQHDFLTMGIVPPLAIAACAMTATSQSFVVPPGSIHASQEFEFLKLVPIGTTISCSGKVANKLERGRLNLITLEIEALDQDQEKVLTGKATIAVPS